MSFFFNFLYTQFFVKLPYPTQDFSGQTIVVTGSNTGLGLEAARHFVRLNAEKVILAVRSIERGEAAKNSIESSTQRRGVVEVWQLDLSSYESVKQFAKKTNTLKRLDVFLENAGWILARSTEEGSRSLVHAALAGPESHGQYLSDCKVTPPAPLVLSEDGAKTQKRVWDELSQKLESIQPGIMANV